MTSSALASPDFTQDVDEAVSYFANTLGSPRAAADLLDGLDAEVARIREYPELRPYSQDPRLASRGYRKSVIGNFVLLYRVDAQRELVRLVHLFYGGRDYARYA